jgi:DnaJ like chaperone protein
MSWIGKAVGGLLGLVTAGPIGSVLGMLLGHQFDHGYRNGSGPGRSAARIQSLFFETTFAVMGHLAKVDGRVSEEEIRVARLIMHNMRLRPEQVRAAIEHFTLGKEAHYPLAEQITRLGNALGHRHDLARAFVEIQLQALIGAASVGHAERELLWQVARSLGIGRAELAAIEAEVRGRHGSAGGSRGAVLGLEEAYRIIGVTPSVGDQEVKMAYRRLMNQHHPDKLVARGLPESMTAVAQQKTQEIRAAYERVKAARNLK